MQSRRPLIQDGRAYPAWGAVPTPSHATAGPWLVENSYLSAPHGVSPHRKPHSTAPRMDTRLRQHYATPTALHQANSLPRMPRGGCVRSLLPAQVPMPASFSTPQSLRQISGQATGEVKPAESLPAQHGHVAKSEGPSPGSSNDQVTPGRSRGQHMVRVHAKLAQMQHPSPAPSESDCLKTFDKTMRALQSQSPLLLSYLLHSGCSSSQTGSVSSASVESQVTLPPSIPAVVSEGRASRSPSNALHPSPPPADATINKPLFTDDLIHQHIAKSIQNMITCSQQSNGGSQPQLQEGGETSSSYAQEWVINPSKPPVQTAGGCLAPTGSGSVVSSEAAGPSSAGESIRLDLNHTVNKSCASGEEGSPESDTELAVDAQKDGGEMSGMETDSPPGNADYNNSADNMPHEKNRFATFDYRLDLLEKLVVSLTSGSQDVEKAAELKGISDVVVQYWKGHLDNLRLFVSMEYPQIMMNVAAFCAKNKDKNPTVLTTVSGMTLAELMEGYPGLRVENRLPPEEYKSSWRNINKNLDDLDKEAGSSWALHLLSLRIAQAAKTDNLQVVTDVGDNIEQQVEPDTPVEGPPIDALDTIKVSVLSPVDARRIYYQDQTDFIKAEPASCDSGPVQVSLTFSGTDQCAGVKDAPNHRTGEGQASLGLRLHEKQAVDISGQVTEVPPLSQGGPSLLGHLKSVEYEDITDDENLPDVRVATQLQSNTLPKTPDEGLSRVSSADAPVYEDISSDDTQSDCVIVECDSTTATNLCCLPPETQSHTNEGSPAHSQDFASALISKGIVDNQAFSPKHDMTVRLLDSPQNGDGSSQCSSEVGAKREEYWMLVPVSVLGLEFEPSGGNKTQSPESLSTTKVEQVSSSSNLDVCDRHRSFLRAKIVKLPHNLTDCTAFDVSEADGGISSHGSPVPNTVEKITRSVESSRNLFTETNHKNIETSSSSDTDDRAGNVTSPSRCSRFTPPGLSGKKSKGTTLGKGQRLSDESTCDRNKLRRGRSTAPKRVRFATSVAEDGERNPRQLPVTPKAISNVLKRKRMTADQSDQGAAGEENKSRKEQKSCPGGSEGIADDWSCPEMQDDEELPWSTCGREAEQRYRVDRKRKCTSDTPVVPIPSDQDDGLKSDKTGKRGFSIKQNRLAGEEKGRVVSPNRKVHMEINTLEAGDKATPNIPTLTLREGASRGQNATLPSDGSCTSNVGPRKSKESRKAPSKERLQPFGDGPSALKKKHSRDGKTTKKTSHGGTVSAGSAVTASSEAKSKISAAGKHSSASTSRTPSSRACGMVFSAEPAPLSPSTPVAFPSKKRIAHIAQRAATPVKERPWWPAVSPETSGGKRKVLSDWRSSFIPTRIERRGGGSGAGLDEERTAGPGSGSLKAPPPVLEHHDAEGEARPPPGPRQRHNSLDAATPLMRKSMCQAKQWTQAIHREALHEQRSSVGRGYKWAERGTQSRRDGFGGPKFSHCTSSPFE